MGKLEWGDIVKDNRPKTCGTCHGRKTVDVIEEQNCSRCSGLGQVPNDDYGSGSLLAYKPCPESNCKSGQVTVIGTKTCGDCGGAGVIF